MVARGDLGVEIPLENVAIMQKYIVKRCREVGKPVVVATQMLESMIKNPRPTRAEVSDVTNAIADGADAVMLSGESANGDYPFQSIGMMRNIIHVTENSLPKYSVLPTPNSEKIREREPTRHEAVAASAVHLAHQVGAAAIIVLTKRGNTARLIASQTPNIPVICFLSDKKVGRQLNIIRSLHPVIMSGVSWKETPAHALKQAVNLGFCLEGDVVVLVSSDAKENDHHTSLSIRLVEV
eukprot:c5001_g1_i1.p1 GENE.c5001_g1_i1~~c5001_g1_i1.p1  ORF type:complete len:238 (-),score=140.08 c5001_g1_i1:8-721(-)